MELHDVVLFSDVLLILNYFSGADTHGKALPV
jgi:hypothetical protein